MKSKLLLIIGILFASPMLFGQTLLTQNFSSGTMPPTGWTIDDHATNWHSSNSMHSGGSSPEAVLAYSPTFNGFSRLISPSVNTTGQTSLTLSFKQFMDFYATPFTIGVATRSGAGSWTPVMQVNPTGSFQQTTVLQINNADVGAADFQFCLFFSGNSFNINNWYLDDIALSVSVARDAAVVALNVPKYSTGHMQAKGTLLNFGTSTLTSADVNYRIGQGTVHTSSLPALALTLGQTSAFTVNDSIILTPGNYNLSIWVSNVNGQGPDMNPANDTLSMILHVATSSVARRPFYEEFTSSTCSPCANFNSTVFTPFLNTHGDQLTLIKYQMNWPSPGDIYYTEEGGVRRDFYGVSYVPDLYVDGKQTNTNGAGVNNAFTTSLASSSFMDVMAHYSFPVNGTDTTVTINADIVPHVSGDLTLYAAVVEKVTYHNHSTNGETEFHNVMMKMVPGPHGTPINIVDGQTKSIEIAADLAGTNIERWNDLMVVLWVQDTVTKEFFQSGYGDSLNVGIRPIVKNAVFRVYPNPVRSTVNISGIQGISEVAFIDSYGREVRRFTDGDLNHINIGNLPEGIYLLRVLSKEGINTAKINLIR